MSGHGYRQQQLSAILSLTVLLLVPMPVFAQFLCDNDGIEIEFLGEVAGALQLREATARELNVRTPTDQSFAVGSTERLTGRLKGRNIRSSTAGFSGYQIGPITGFERALPNAWEAKFPMGRYEFRDKADIELQIMMTIADSQASHYTAGQDSTVTLEVEESRVQKYWYSGTNSLRVVRGSLELRVSELEKLGAAGIHRATLSVCVNVRGNL